MKLKLDPRTRIKGKAVFNFPRNGWKNADFKFFGILLGLT